MILTTAIVLFNQSNKSAVINCEICSYFKTRGKCKSVQGSKQGALFRKGQSNTSGKMEQYFDEYDYYNFDRKVVEPPTRKGRTKREASLNTNRPNPGGHERKVVQKLINTEKRRRVRLV